MNSYTFIVNPRAGKGDGRAVFASLRTEIERSGISCTVVMTERPGHATQAAREAVTPVVVGVGGDGTLNEIANGLSGTTRMLGIIPAGSGNDFIKSVGIPRRPLDAFRVLLAGRSRTVDAGTVRCAEQRGGGGNSPPRLFVNGVGAGFDAAVAARTRDIPLLGGTPLYLAAVFQTLGHYAAPAFRLEGEHVQREAPSLLIAVGNGVCAGGGFYLTPDASIDDGLLDICAVDDKNVLEILKLMPRVMRGKHHNVPGVNFFRDTNFTITADTRFYVHADGEIVGENVRRVEIGLLKSHLSVIAREPDAGS
ncbi:MAG TPA: diacylglycerol kinase family protein [Bacteroidota bacterium]|nr:diacylglycerol kinase family protein [Bacteroidota bacterium]